MAVGKLDGTGRKILVIDDDLAIRVLLQAVLRRMKFDVDLAEDGAVGLDKLRHNGVYDLVLLDLMMPRLNGYEFIEEVSKRYPGQRLNALVHPLEHLRVRQLAVARSRRGQRRGEAEDADGLREVHRRKYGVRRNRRGVLADRHFVGGEAAVFAAEDERQRLIAAQL